MPYDRGVARSCINGRQGKVADVRTEVFVRHLKGSPDRASLVSGKIISYTYNSMISLAFISAEYAKEGTELEILWGTPGTRQMKVRAKVARFPYNQDYIRNEKRDVSDIPVFER